MTSTAAPPRGTVRFGLDGTEHEIDLNAGHDRESRDALTRYVNAARRGAVWRLGIRGACRQDCWR
jgi:hypothetical protein